MPAKVRVRPSPLRIVPDGHTMLPSGIVVSSDTRVPPPKEPGPLVETTLLETLAVRKFALAGQADLVEQVARAAQSGMPQRQFLEIKRSGEAIVAWLANVVETCDHMLESAQKKEDTDAGQSAVSTQQ